MSEEKLAGKFTSEEELVKGLTNLMGVESLEDVYKTLESQRNKPSQNQSQHLKFLRITLKF